MAITTVIVFATTKEEHSQIKPLKRLVLFNFIVQYMKNKAAHNVLVSNRKFLQIFFNFGVNISLLQNIKYGLGLLYSEIFYGNVKRIFGFLAHLVLHFIMTRCFSWLQYVASSRFNILLC